MVILARRGEAGLGDPERFIQITGTTIVPFDRRQAECALQAFRRYGKGLHSGARLAPLTPWRKTSAPLLFKGGDFSETDIQSAG